MTQQTSLSFLTDSGNRRQLRSKIAQLAPLAMIGHRVTMRLVANHLNQAQNRRMRIEINRLVLAAFYQKIGDLIVMKRGLDYADHRYGFQIEFAHGFGGRVKLRFAAIDNN